MTEKSKEQWPHDPNAKPGQRGYMGPSYVRPFGREEGMADRLLEHVRILGTDKTKPWVGMGLIDDLLKASEMLGGPPVKLPLAEARAEVFASLAGEARDGVKRPAPTPAPAPALEYDL